MDFKQLDIFIHTAECRSFSDAAREMSITQPTISTNISALERELGVTLIERTTKSFFLTEKGAQLYEYAQKLIRLRDKTIADISQNYDEKIIHLGISSIPNDNMVTSIITEYKQKCPDIKFRNLYLDSMTIIDKIIFGVLDIGFVGTVSTDNRIVFEPFAKDELVIAAPANDYFKELKKKNVDIIELMKEPIILRESTSGNRRESDRAFRNMGLDPNRFNIAAYIKDSELVKRSVLNGLGISVLSRSTIKEEENKGKVIVFPFGEKPLEKNIFIAYSYHKDLPDYVKQFIEFVIESSQLNKR